MAGDALGDEIAGTVSSTNASTPMAAIVPGRCFDPAQPLADAPGTGAARQLPLQLSGRLDDLPDDPVLERFLGRHPVVAVGVLRHALQRLAGGLGDRAVQPLARLQDLLGLAADLGGLPAHAAERLVDHETRVGQAEAVLLRRREIDVRARARHPARAHHAHAGLHEADHVVDGVARLDVAAFRVDEDGDRVVAFGREREEVCGDLLRELRVDLAVDQDGARPEQALEDLARERGREGKRLLGLVLVHGFSWRRSERSGSARTGGGGDGSPGAVHTPSPSASTKIGLVNASGVKRGASVDQVASGVPSTSTVTNPSRSKVSGSSMRSPGRIDRVVASRASRYTRSVSTGTHGAAATLTRSAPARPVKRSPGPAEPSSTLGIGPVVAKARALWSAAKKAASSKSARVSSASAT